MQQRVCVIGTVGSELGGQCDLPLADALRAWFGAEMPPAAPTTWPQLCWPKRPTHCPPAN
ncbi:hypothetical protein [Ideonella paludis]|uniref:hypothetical protein n=1 Tax=Ideonella paludis TaxID=1233411 RepID=UPI00363965C6